MDPISLVLAALATGAAKAAGDAIPDAYTGLKALIKRKFQSNAAAAVVLEEYEKDPETYETPLKKKLTEAEVDRDADIVKAAEELLKQLEPEAAVAGKFNLQVSGDIKGIVGDVSGGTISQNIH